MGHRTKGADRAQPPRAFTTAWASTPPWVLALLRADAKASGFTLPGSPDSSSRPVDAGPGGIQSSEAENAATGQPALPYVTFRHDPYMQAAHRLAGHGWEGGPNDRVTGYRGRNDEWQREYDRKANGARTRTLADIGREYGGRHKSTVSRAVKESKRRAVAVSEAIRRKMAREPAAEVEFLFSLRTDRDTPPREDSSSLYYSTIEAERGLVADACRIFGIQEVGGNVGEVNRAGL